MKTKKTKYSLTKKYLLEVFQQHLDTTVSALCQFTYARACLITEIDSKTKEAKILAHRAGSKSSVFAEEETPRRLDLFSRRAIKEGRFLHMTELDENNRELHCLGYPIRYPNRKVFGSIIITNASLPYGLNTAKKTMQRFARIIEEDLLLAQLECTNAKSESNATG